MNKGCAIALISTLALLVAGGVAADETPPRDLHLVGDHWTAWDPPAEFPDGATVYTIERGDTLWDLAGRFYGDPYLWPQLWEQNRYVLDAHWIYPGDPLLVDVEVTSADEYAESVREEEPGAPGEEGPEDDDALRGVLTADRAAGPPVPLGAEADIYCSGFIGGMDEEFPFRLIGSEHGALTPSLAGPASEQRWKSIYEYRRETVRYDLATGDVVYLASGGQSGLTPGDLLTVVSPREPVFHPRTGDAIGRFHRYLGRVRVLSVQEETAIAEILDSCGPIRVGDALRRFEPQPVPLGRRSRMRPINLPVSMDELRDAPTILRGDDPVVSMGQGTLVFIDRGTEDDVLPGDVFTIYRHNKPGLPPVVLGELAVLSTEDDTALARILESRYVVYSGDLLDRK